MKVLIGAALAFVFAAGAAFAQSTAPNAAVPPSHCGDLLGEPTLPDGATANSAAMQAGETAYQGWVSASQQVLECRRGEINDLMALETARRAEFNARGGRISALTNAWVRERREFTRRPAHSRH